MRVPDAAAFGVWLLALAAVIFPALWASAQVDKWADAAAETEEAPPMAGGEPGAEQLEWPLAGQMTINDLVRLSGQIAHSKGWNDYTDANRIIHMENTYAQLAALSPVVLALGRVAQTLRRHPGDSPEVATAVKELHEQTERLTMWRRWMVGAADDHAERLIGEYGAALAGSKTEALAHVVLRVSEAAEEAQGIIAGDLPNTLEEIGDQWIRAGARLWAWAFVAPPTWAEVPHPPVLADFETVLRAKMEQNVGMEHRKGGLRA